MMDYLYICTYLHKIICKRFSTKKLKKKQNADYIDAVITRLALLLSSRNSVRKNKKKLTICCEFVYPQ